MSADGTEEPIGQLLKDQLFARVVGSLEFDEVLNTISQAAADHP